MSLFRFAHLNSHTTTHLSWIKCEDKYYIWLFGHLNKSCFISYSRLQNQIKLVSWPRNLHLWRNCQIWGLYQCWIFSAQISSFNKLNIQTSHAFQWLLAKTWASSLAQSRRRSATWWTGFDACVWKIKGRPRGNNGAPSPAVLRPLIEDKCELRKDTDVQTKGGCLQVLWQGAWGESKWGGSQRVMASVTLDSNLAER